MEPRDFLRLAESLAQAGAEAELRTAVSRAYYAAFHVARKLFLNCGFMVPQADRAHGYLWLRLSNTREAQTRWAGEELKRLRSERNRADYQLLHPFTASDSQRCLRTAREIILRLEVAFREPLKTQLTEAIKRYERDVLREVTWQSPPSN
jgi:uncharacterized protein (UPF0332 family)